MERLAQSKRKRPHEDEEKRQWGSEQLEPREGDRRRRTAAAAYRILRREGKLGPSVRTNPIHLAIAMAMQERGARKGDGMKAKLLRDYQLKETVDLSAATRQLQVLGQTLDKPQTPRRREWAVLEGTLELHHQTIWPCVLRGAGTTRVHGNAEAAEKVMRILEPLTPGKDYKVRMDDLPTKTQQPHLLPGSQYATLHVRDADAAEAIAQQLMGENYPAPAWAEVPEKRVQDESALSVLLTGTQRGSASTCHTDGIHGAWCVIAGTRDVYVCSPEEGKQHIGNVSVIEDASYIGAREEHRRGVGPPWRRISVQAGDWVFMPKKWWHQVYATPDSVMLSFYADAPTPPHYA